MNPVSTRKSREQQFHDFFLILQKEYIVAELRYKIYPDLKGKNKSLEIMAGKKAKITDIAIKNNVKTIFDDIKLGQTLLYDENLKLKLYSDIYGFGGLPNFIYRDDEQYKALSQKDKNCYFLKGAKVLITDLGNGILIDVDFETETAKIKISSFTENFPLKSVQRIFK
jgi:hypothetical protein